MYCLPVLKREEHRLALVKAATSGNPKFFLGTDSAPHAIEAKISACGESEQSLMMLVLFVRASKCGHEVIEYTAPRRTYPLGEVNFSTGFAAQSRRYRCSGQDRTLCPQPHVVAISHVVWM